MTPRAKNLALALLAMTQFVIVIDASIVNVALPSIGTALHFSQNDLSWVINAYTLTFGGFLLLGGRLADLMGRRRMFILGARHLLARLARGRLRAVRGLADRRARRAGPRRGDRLAGRRCRSSRRPSPKARSATARSASGAPSRAPAAPPGVMLGGVLTSGLSWRWVLFVNVPIGALLRAARSAHPPRRATPRSRTRSFDFPGAVTVTGGLSLLVYAVVDAVNAGWGSTQTLLELAGALALLIAFVLIEMRAGSPLMPFSIFRLRTLRGADTVALLIGMSLFSMFFFISLYMQQVLALLAR